MVTDDFVMHEYVSLREEIRDSKTRIFWLLLIGMFFVLLSAFMAAEYPKAFANAAIPFLLLGLMLSFVSEQNNIAQRRIAGRSPTTADASLRHEPPQRSRKVVVAEPVQCN